MTFCMMKALLILNRGIYIREIVGYELFGVESVANVVGVIWRPVLRQGLGHRTSNHGIKHSIIEFSYPAAGYPL